MASGKLVKVKGLYKLPLAPKRAAFAPVKKKIVPVSKPKATSLKTTKEKKPAPSKANPKQAAKKTSARSVKSKSVKSPVKKVVAKKGKNEGVALGGRLALKG
ncbi:Hypothetical predicted protein [Olea europaea subsp. europaea]|uniref:Uncharacterized protein n=1 Tax=Olea europaea subsp. europaea TaxID=158383 RepID=A0A8S0Q1B9_OLEEU|nr:Hypothetical predicted protein [Olea europaea subsp. europaea]